MKDYSLENLTYGVNNREDLILRTITIVSFLWEEKPKYRSLMSERELSDLKSSGTFSPMYRSWIPKPNKPGAFRPITQPYAKDVIQLDAFTVLLNALFNNRF